MRQGRDKEKRKEERERNEGKEGEGDKEGAMKRLRGQKFMFLYLRQASRSPGAGRRPPPRW